MQTITEANTTVAFQLSTGELVMVHMEETIDAGIFRVKIISSAKRSPAMMVLPSAGNCLEITTAKAHAAEEAAWEKLKAAKAKKTPGPAAKAPHVCQFKPTGRGQETRCACGATCPF